MKVTTCINVLVILFLFIACSTKKRIDNRNKRGKIIPVTRLITKDTLLTHEYVADIQAVQNVEIRARVEGFLENIYVDEGQEVKRGQPLFRISSEEYKEAVTRANANLKSAQAGVTASEVEVKRVRTLVEKKVISKTELNVAIAKLEAAKAKVEEARSSQANTSIKLSYTFIKSPFDGIVDRIPLKVGSLISKGTLLTKVSDVNEIFAYFSVSEGEYLEYIKTREENPEINNSAVKLVLADGSLYEQTGKVETMEGEFDASTGSLAFRARFPNPKKILKHGASGKIKLTNKIENALIIPQKAVFEIQDKNFVFVVDSTNRVNMKSFVPQTRFSYFYIIQSGLKPGDRIVYEGIQNIRDGVQIIPKMVKMDSLLALAP